jgi:drug/metabolite transporter (DMT)-like permease
MGTAALTQRIAAVPATALETLGAALVMALAGSGGGRVWEDIGHGALHWPLWVWLGLLYLAVLAQAGACLLQVWGQRHISATEAALAFNVEPVWTVWFAWLILGETLVWRQWLGAALILASVCIVSLPGSDDRG